MNAVDWAWSAMTALWGVNIGFYWASWLHQRRGPSFEHRLGLAVLDLAERRASVLKFAGDVELDSSLIITANGRRTRCQIMEDAA